MTQELRDKLTKILETELEYDELYDSLYQLVVESQIERLKLLKQEYHDNIVSDDRMDMEIDESIAQLQSQLSSIGDAK